MLRAEVEYNWEFRLTETGILKVPQVSWLFKLLALGIFVLVFVPTISIPLLAFYPNGISDDPILVGAFAAFVIAVPTIVFVWVLEWRKRKVAGLSNKVLSEWQSARVMAWFDIYRIVVTRKKLLIDTETKQYRPTMKSDFDLIKTLLREMIGERLEEKI